MFRRTAILMFVWILLAGSLATADEKDDEKADRQPSADDEYYELYKTLADVMDQVERNYVKDIDRRELMEAAIQGVLSKLDPHSSYIAPDQISRFRGNMESQFGGIGIQISTRAGQLTVISPLVGTPAYRAGVLAGDRIVEIDGETTEGLTIDEAVRRLKGAEGTKVVLTVIHPHSADKIEIKIKRKIIHVDTVLGDHRNEKNDSWNFILDPENRIGYIRITAFSRDTADELRRAMKRLKSDKFQGLVLDLRFNPGGLLSSAIEVSDLFVAKGRIVSTSGRNSLERTWDAMKRGTYEDFPMAVLVNRYSASASEIVSACLQDHDRAVIVGERTWGKGSVQNVIPLEDGRSAMKLTTAGYRRPNGKNIHRFPDAEEDDEWGVIPNDGYRLRLTDTELLALIFDRKGRDIVQAPAEEETDEGEAEEEDEPEDSLFVDRQLQKALDHITDELAEEE